VARQAVQESLVLLKNDKACRRFRRRRESWSQVTARTTLPGNRAAGRCRGRAPGSTCFPRRDHLVAGYCERPRRGRTGHASSRWQPGAKPDAAIVVFGETPYAEFQGDLRSLQLKPDLRAPLETSAGSKPKGCRWWP
jgi:beta-glucosidase